MALTLKQAKKFYDDNWLALEQQHERDLALPCGGFYNPEVVDICGNVIVFRCHYDGFDNDADSWEWYYDIETKEFFH